MKEYHKIETLYERSETTKKIIVGKFRNETVEFLKDNVWQFTEKVDGTNIRVCWNGHNVSFAGRKEKSQIPIHLLEKLEELFGGNINEQMFEQKFGNKEVILFGEGYGHKIQDNGYIDGVNFTLFDVLIGDTWLERESVENIASYFDISVVPVVLEGTLQDGINFVKEHNKTLVGYNGAFMEGVVGRPKTEILDRLGQRVIVKIRYYDIEEIIKQGDKI